MVTIRQPWLTICNLMMLGVPMNSNKFPFLEISEDLAYEIGERDKSTRVYRKKGNYYGFQAWIFHLHKLIEGSLVPANWVPAYVGVSRAAVHKRIKLGRLTVLVFEHYEQEETYRRRTVERKKGEYDFCIASECDAWVKEIEDRESRKYPPYEY